MDTGISGLLRLAVQNAAQGSDDGDELPGRPLMAAQYFELGLRFARLQEQHDFEPGQFVKMKAGVGWFKRSGADIALVLVRRINTASAYDQHLLADHVKHLPAPMMALPPDWVVASVTDSGDTLAYWLIPQMILEPVSDEEAQRV